MASPAQDDHGAASPPRADGRTAGAEPADNGAVVARVAQALARETDDAKLEGLVGHVAQLWVDLAEACARAWRSIPGAGSVEATAGTFELACIAVWSKTRAFLRGAGTLEVLRARGSRDDPARRASGATAPDTRAAPRPDASTGRSKPVTAILLGTLPATGASFADQCDRLSLVVGMLVHAVKPAAVAAAEQREIVRGPEHRGGAARMTASLQILARIAIAIHDMQVQLRSDRLVGRFHRGDNSARRVQLMGYDGLRDGVPRRRAADMGKGLVKPEPGARVSTTIMFQPPGGDVRRGVVQLGTVRIRHGVRWVVYCPRCGKRCRELLDVGSDLGPVCFVCTGGTLLSQRAGHRQWYRAMRQNLGHRALDGLRALCPG